MVRRRSCSVGGVDLDGTPLLPFFVSVPYTRKVKRFQSFLFHLLFTNITLLGRLYYDVTSNNKTSAVLCLCLPRSKGFQYGGEVY